MDILKPYVSTSMTDGGLEMEMHRPPTTYNSNCGSMLCICALLSIGALKSSEVRQERILRLLATLQFSKLLVCFIIPVRIRLIQCMMQKNLHISRVKNSFLKIDYLPFAD